MSSKQTAPYGSWRSPITADMIVSGSIALAEIHLDGDSVYWTESRPSEGGRSVLMERGSDGSYRERTAAPHNVRTRVHEYGGGAFTVHAGTAYYSNFDDNHVYAAARDSTPHAITDNGDLRYADFTVDAHRDRLICVCEDHREAPLEAVNTLVALSFTPSGEHQVIASGNDFYSSPVLHPDGSKLAWMTWHHPSMPWDGSELWLADVASDGSISNAMQIAGGAEESVFQPQWSPDGVLYYISDRTNWWNLYRFENGKSSAVAKQDAEFGTPQWVFGMSTYAFADDGTLCARVLGNGETSLLRMDPRTDSQERIEMQYTLIDQVRAAGERVVFVGGSPTRWHAIAEYNSRTHEVHTLRESSTLEVPVDLVSVPQPIEFPTARNRTAHGFYYAPHNPEFEAPSNELPPLIVRSHGGPTGATDPGLRLGYQYWTTRGFAILDVNYGGSTGYGREYRQRLNGEWGVVDIEDCVAGAQYLVEQGKADSKRLIIVGGSAGGYTTLRALTATDVFAAGASYFGIGDLEPFIADTHKFESRYVDSLVGPYPAMRDVYRERSPINHTDELSCPVILFQGLDDKVVPPNQAELMVEAMRQKGLPYAYVAYKGEGHGFRRAENIKRTLDGELYFYSRIFQFDLPDAVEPVTIENLPG